MKANYNPKTIAMETRLATCDRGCKETFTLSINEEVLGDVPSFGRVVRKYLKCPHCGMEYDIGFADKVVQDLLDENERMLLDNKNKLLHRQITQREFDFVTRKIQKNKRKGIERMDKIERAYKAMKKS